MKPTRKSIKKIKVAKNCSFCEKKIGPEYKETAILSKFISERGKILGRAKTGVCAKHQRQLTTAIKHARHVALLPFVVHV